MSAFLLALMSNLTVTAVVVMMVIVLLVMAAGMFSLVVRAVLT